MKWELFEFKVRQSAIYVSKQVKSNNLDREQKLMAELGSLLKKKKR